MNLLLKGGRIIDPANQFDQIADIAIDGDKIAQVAQDIQATPDATVISCAGKTISPGLIDPHVHLRVPGQEYKEDVESGTAAAAAGGFTAVACQPNTNPPIDRAATVSLILEQAKTASARVHVVGAVSMGLKNEELSEMADLKAAGAVAIGDDAFPVQSSGFMRRAMQYTAMLNLPFLAHCEDKDLTGQGVMNEGYVSTILGLKGIPRWAENIATARNAMLSLDTGCRLHIQHVSTKESVEIVRMAKKWGAPITAETCPQYFLLTDDACLDYKTNAKISPPLRRPEDIEALLAGLADDTIDMIATDHAPHACFEKEREFALASFGAIGLETSLGLCVDALVNKGVLSLPKLIEKMSTAPARMLGVPAGSLGVGDIADITIIDMNHTWPVDPETFRSKSRNTLFSGVTLPCKAVATIVGGKVI
jgi:dihydroorotase